MTGNFENADCGLRIADSPLTGEVSQPIRAFFRTPNSTFRTHNGFSLLELMIAMFIMIILLSVAIPTYQRSVQHARETVLKENLWQIRRAIDQFASDKGKLPQSIDELVVGKYLREKPIDPILEKTEWKEIMGEDGNSPDAEQGLTDVESLAEGEDSEGVPYREYGRPKAN